MMVFLRISVDTDRHIISIVDLVGVQVNYIFIQTRALHSSMPPQVFRSAHKKCLPTPQSRTRNVYIIFYVTKAVLNVQANIHLQEASIGALKAKNTVFKNALWTHFPSNGELTARFLGICSIKPPTLEVWHVDACVACHWSATEPQKLYY